MDQDDGLLQPYAYHGCILKGASIKWVRDRQTIRLFGKLVGVAILILAHTIRASKFIEKP